VSRLQDYDPTVIEVAARRLYEKATTSLFASIVVGTSVGAAFGAVPLTPLGSAWPIPSSFGPATMLVGALCGAAIGYVIGDNRAFRHRLQAQAMLTDLQRELNTAATVEALKEIVVQLTDQFERDRELREAVHEPAPAPALPTPEPAPAPAPTPTPPAVLITVPPASPEPPPRVFSLPEPALSPPEPAPAFSVSDPAPAFSVPEPVVAETFAFPAPEEPAISPEPEPAPAFSVPEPAPTPAFSIPEPAPAFSVPEPVVAESFAFSALEELATSPEPEPEAEADKPSASARDVFPPLSADAL
jgi:hypothetical protein